jgi:hypothetical protein
MHYLLVTLFNLPWIFFWTIPEDFLMPLNRSVYGTGFLAGGPIKSQLVEANGELQKLSATANAIKAENTRLENTLSVEKVALKNVQDGFNRVSTELEVIKTSQQHQTEKLKELQDKNVTLETLNHQYLKRGAGTCQ